MVSPDSYPELIFGLVGPLGADLHSVSRHLSEALRHVDYDAQSVRLSRLMSELPVAPWSSLPENGPADESLDAFMTAGNALRSTLKRGDALALMGIAAIREYRASKLETSDEPCARTAYIFHSLKRPEEAQTLKKIYGSTFFLIAAYAPRSKRVTNVAQRIAQSRFSHQAEEFYAKAEELIRRDENESADQFGQNVLDTFPLADAIVNTADQRLLRESLTRFVELVFGNPFHTPTKDEQGIKLAFASGYRSGSLARQVGAALCRDDGSVIAMGCNEVPRSNGGQYWPGELDDARDFYAAQDSSDRMRSAVLGDILERLRKAGMLDADCEERTIPELLNECLFNGDAPIMRGALFSRTVDYVRAIHAEMATLMDAARHGTSTKDATLYTTTYPCHDCAKHIIGAGIKRVVYVEPYPKSLVQELYSDSVSIDAGETCDFKVKFESFVGIGPNRYDHVFGLSGRKRKLKDGSVAVWRSNNAKPYLSQFGMAAGPRIRAEQVEFNLFREEMIANGIVSKEREHES
jgi:deoxycytidylate deaminase